MQLYAQIRENLRIELNGEQERRTYFCQNIFYFCKLEFARPAIHKL